MDKIFLKNKLRGCLTLGAIGDAIGSRYEGSYSNENIEYNFEWTISDDTQLTLATCESIYKSHEISCEKVAANFLKWFNERRLTGLGASTLKALTELQAGGHWALVGRSGEYAAGNGAAMRIAPLAFKKNVDRQLLHDLCSITHKNDEAYVGALAIYYSVLKATNNEWSGDTDLIEKILPELPDTNVKDRLIELDKLRGFSITSVADKFKTSGYVVDSVPLAVFSAQKIKEQTVKEIFNSLIKVGGDTDTICSMTGQILGALIGFEKIPVEFINKLSDLDIKKKIDTLVDDWED